MDNILSGNRYFRTNELSHDTVELSTRLPYIRESNIILFLETLALISRSRNKIIIDVSKIDDIDSLSIKMIIREMTKINSKGGSVKLVVSEDKPIISFSNGDQISKMDVYLSLKVELKDTRN